MPRYIDAEEFKRKLINEKSFFPAIVANALEETPTADVEEVKHAYWKRESDGVCYWYVCSECHDDIPLNRYGGWSFPNYCPNCGAKIDRDDPQEESDT